MPIRTWVFVSAILVVLLGSTQLRPQESKAAPTGYRNFLPIVAIDALHTPTPTPEPTATPTSCNTKGQLLQDTSFELAPSSWGVVSGEPYITDRRATSGLYSVYFAGYNNAIDGIYQPTVVPNWAETGAIYFNWIMFSDDLAFVATDYFGIGVGHAGTLIWSGTISNTNSRGAWWQARLSLPNIIEYRGKTLDVLFLATTDYTLPTSWYLDDAQFWIGCGSQIANFESRDNVQVLELQPSQSEQFESALRERMKTIGEQPARQQLSAFQMSNGSENSRQPR